MTIQKNVIDNTKWNNYPITFWDLVEMIDWERSHQIYDLEILRRWVCLDILEGDVFIIKKFAEIAKLYKETLRISIEDQAIHSHSIRNIKSRISLKEGTIDELLYHIIGLGEDIYLKIIRNSNNLRKYTKRNDLFIYDNFADIFNYKKVQNLEIGNQEIDEIEHLHTLNIKGNKLVEYKTRFPILKSTEIGDWFDDKFLFEVLGHPTIINDKDKFCWCIEVNSIKFVTIQTYCSPTMIDNKLKRFWVIHTPRGKFDDNLASIITNYLRNEDPDRQKNVITCDNDFNEEEEDYYRGKIEEDLEDDFFFWGTRARRLVVYPFYYTM